MRPSRASMSLTTRRTSSAFATSAATNVAFVKCCRRGLSGVLDQVDQRHLRPFGGEALGDREPDPACGAGNERATALQAFGISIGVVLRVLQRSARATGRAGSAHHSLHDPG